MNEVNLFGLLPGLIYTAVHNGQHLKRKFKVKRDGGLYNNSDGSWRNFCQYVPYGTRFTPESGTIDPQGFKELDHKRSWVTMEKDIPYRNYWGDIYFRSGNNLYRSDGGEEDYYEVDAMRNLSMDEELSPQEELTFVQARRLSELKEKLETLNELETASETY